MDTALGPAGQEGWKRGRNSLCAGGWSQPGETGYQKEVETPQRPAGVLIKAINGVDKMTFKRRLGKLGGSGQLAKPP